MESKVADLLQRFREKTITLLEVKGPTLYEKATENTTQMLQALILLFALFFQWIRKNREAAANLRREAPESEEPRSDQPRASEPSGVDEINADSNKED